MNRRGRLGIWAGLTTLLILLVGGTASPGVAQGPPSRIKGQRLRELLSPTGYAALMHVRAARGVGIRALLPPDEEEEEGSVIPKDNFVTAEPEPDDAPFGSGGPEGRGFGRNKRFQNVFVNDPCLDPPPYAPFPENFLRTVQSETEIAVLNKVPKTRTRAIRRRARTRMRGRVGAASWSQGSTTHGVSTTIAKD